MTAMIGRVREKWSSARKRRQSKRRGRALKHVEARTDRDRYEVRAPEGSGGGGDGGVGGGAG